MRVFLSLVLGLLSTLAAAESLPLVSSIEPGSPSERILRQRLDLLFGKAGLSYTLTYRPAQRAELELQNGQFAGDPARTLAFGLRHPQLLRLQAPLAISHYYAFSQQQRINSWQDLHGLSVSYPRGSRELEQILRGQATLWPVDSLQSCLAMVRAARSQICVTSSAVPLQRELSSLQRSWRISQFAPLAVYLYLQPEHAAAAQRLDPILSNLQPQFKPVQ